MADNQIPGEANYLEELHLGGIARIQFLSCSQPIGTAEIGWSDRFHIVLPQAGSFQYREGKSSAFLDINAAIFIHAQREYRISHPVEGDASLAIFPRKTVLDELTSMVDHRRDTKRRLRSAACQVAVRKLKCALRNSGNELEVDEALIALLASFSSDKGSSLNAQPRAQSIASRAQEYILNQFREPLTIDQIASAVGVSPVHLSQIFRKVTGASLHRYIMDLRLSEALARVDDCDLTTLAFDLGFSSHSHFTAAFRQRYGQAPSSFRMEREHATPSFITQPEAAPSRARAPLCWSRCAV